MIPVLASLLCIAGAGTDDAVSQRLEQIEQATRALDYPRALSLARETLSRGEADTEQTRRLWRRIGELSASMGFEEPAVDAFARWLLLTPGADLAPDASPKLHAPFSRAKQRVGTQRLFAEPRSEWLEEGIVRTRLKIGGDVLGMVRSMRLLHPTEAGVRALSFVPGEEPTVEWQCHLRECPYFIRLLDDFGNELFEVGSEATPLMVANPSAPPGAVTQAGPGPESIPMYRRPAPWLIAAGTFAVATAGAWVWRGSADAQVREMDLRRPAYSFAEYQEARAERDTATIVTVSGLGGALLSASVAGALFVF